MLRVRSDALRRKGDRWYLSDNPFSGLVFHVDGENVDRISVCENGYETRPWHTSLTSDKAMRICVDCGEIFDDSGDQLTPVLVDGKEFSGALYEFDGAFCVTELICKQGRVVCVSSWYKSGCQASFEDWRSHEFSQYIYWHTNGNYSSVERVEKDRFNFTIKMNNLGGVNSIRIDGEYFSRIGSWEDLLYSELAEKKYDFARFELAKELYLGGSSVDDEVLKFLGASENFNQLEKITLYKTNISEVGLNKLVELSNIELLSVYHEDPRFFDLIDKIRDKNPNCRIEVSSA